MDEIAERAGVSKPVLYQHFPGKLELYLALLDQHVELLGEQVRKALASTTDNKERVTACIQAYFDFVDEHAEGFRLLMTETIGAEEEFRRTVASVRDTILSDVADLIVRESKGTLDREHAEIVALALIGMVETVAQRNPGDSPDRRTEAIDLLVRLAWRGITNL
jgi:AcrR family transcriptional regulator